MIAPDGYLFPRGRSSKSYVDEENGREAVTFYQAFGIGVMPMMPTYLEFLFGSQ